MRSVKDVFARNAESVCSTVFIITVSWEITSVRNVVLNGRFILYNNQSPYTTALLVPNKERLRKHLAHQNLDLTSDQGREEAIRIIQRQIDRFRKGGDLSTLFPDRWLPTTFAILPEPFTEQNGMVNSTMKIVRGKVEKAYAARIAQLYTPEGKNPQNKWNKEAL